MKLMRQTDGRTIQQIVQQALTNELRGKGWDVYENATCVCGHPDYEHIALPRPEAPCTECACRAFQLPDPD